MGGAWEGHGRGNGWSMGGGMGGAWEGEWVEHGRGNGWSMGGGWEDHVRGNGWSMGVAWEGEWVEYGRGNTSSLSTQSQSSWTELRVAMGTVTWSVLFCECEGRGAGMEDILFCFFLGWRKEWMDGVRGGEERGDGWGERRGGERGWTG